MSRRTSITLSSLVGSITMVALLSSLTSCSQRPVEPPKDNIGTAPFDGSKAFTHVEKILTYGPRPPGSPALLQVTQYIRDHLTSLGLTPAVQSFQPLSRAQQRLQKSRLSLPLNNIWVQIDGSDPKSGPILALACHYDSKLCKDHEKPEHNFHFVGAIDGGGATGVLLELAGHLVARQKAEVAKADSKVPNIWLLFFDGEESLEFDWKDDLALLGSRFFVDDAHRNKDDPRYGKSLAKSHFPDGLATRMKVLVLLDLIGDKNIKIDSDAWSNAALIAIFREIGAAMGEGRRMFEHKSPIKDDHVPFKEKGVLVIDLIDFHHRIPDQDGKPPHPDYAAWWHTPNDTIDKMSPQALQFAGRLVWYALPKIEQRFYGR